MPVTARGHRYRFAMGKQTAEGTPQTTPLYEYSMRGGSIEPTQSEVPFETTDADDLIRGYYKQTGSSMGDPELFSDVEAIGLPWKLHLGAEAHTGAGDPYTSTITKTDAPLFATIYQMRPDTMGGTDLWEYASDAYIKGVTLNAANPGDPVYHSLDVIGKSHLFNVSAPTPTNDRRIGATSTQLLSYIGATISLDLAATPATTQVHTLKNVQVQSQWGSATWVQTDEFPPRFLDKGGYTCNVSANAVFDSFTSYASTFFGSATVSSNMAQSPVTVNGSFKAKFSILPTVDNTTRYLEVQLPAVRWAVTAPKPDLSGAHVTLAMAGSVYKPASGEAITVVLKNAKSAAY